MTSKYDTQVTTAHYTFSNYYYPSRWMSYWHQTNEITSRDEITSVLDIGPGTDMLKNVLLALKPSLNYTSADIAADVEPDIIGGVTDLPVEDATFDAVCAFQVLEHIKYEDVPRALKELSRVSKRFVFISVPHFGPSLEWQLKVPFLPRLRLAWKVPYRKTHTFNGQHYWELGKKGYSPKSFKALLEEQYTVISDFVPFENQYHHFYILEKK